MTLIYVCIAGWIFLNCLRIYIVARFDRNNLKVSMDSHTAWLAERNPHCDSCSMKEGIEPITPVMRCAKCSYCVSLWTGDPMFGFDFEKYKSK